MASDFDDIFGDLKEDEQFSATLPSDFDEASIFGDTAPTSSSSIANKPHDVNKPAVDGSGNDAAAQPPPAPALDMAVAPVSIAATASSAAPSSSAKPLWEQIGNSEQDDFLSWLDDGAAPTESSAASAAEIIPMVDAAAMDDVSLDAPCASDTHISEEKTVVTPPALPIHVATALAAANPETQGGVGGEQISLDGDDDDDFLERIVENAKKKANSSSRESSNSSLHIKSQNSSLQRVPVFGKPHFLWYSITPRLSNL